MGHITKQERRGLEELFISIEHKRYHSKFTPVKKLIRNVFRLIKLSLLRKPLKK